MNHEAGEKHPLLIWMSLRPGDTVALEGPNMQIHEGTVETRTKDGEIIWLRTELNERKMFHICDCKSVKVIESRQ